MTQSRIVSVWAVYIERTGTTEGERKKSVFTDGWAFCCSSAVWYWCLEVAKIKKRI